jgi:hypothetical protein
MPNRTGLASPQASGVAEYRAPTGLVLPVIIWLGRGAAPVWGEQLVSFAMCAKFTGFVRFAGYVVIRCSVPGLVVFTSGAQRPHGDSVRRGVLVVILVCRALLGEFIAGQAPRVHRDPRRGYHEVS